MLRGKTFLDSAFIHRELPVLASPEYFDMCRWDLVGWRLGHWQGLAYGLNWVGFESEDMQLRSTRISQAPLVDSQFSSRS